jgi:hypothetical protein
MPLESKRRSDRADKTAKEELSKMTGRPESDFDASEYDIPDFEDQEVKTTE